MKKQLFILLLLSYTLSCKNRDIFDPPSKVNTPLDSIIILTLTGHKDAIADGKQIIEAIATIPAKSAEKYRSVTLKIESSGGTFISSDTGESKVVTVDAQGKAKAKFRVGIKPGKFIISAQVTGTNYISEQQFELARINTEDKLSIELTDTSGKVADGQSIIKIKIKLSNSPSTKVKLTSTNGEFIGSSSPLSRDLFLSASGEGEAILSLSNEVIDYCITAEESNDVISKCYKPGIAYPEDLIIEHTALVIDSSGGEIKFGIYPIRGTGVVSKGQIVYFSSKQVDSTGNLQTVGNFLGRQIAKTGFDGSVPDVMFSVNKYEIHSSNPIEVKIWMIIKGQMVVEKNLTIRIIK